MKRILVVFLICLIELTGCNEKEANINKIELEIVDNKELEKGNDYVVLYNGYLLKKEIKRQSCDFEGKYDEKIFNKTYWNYEGGVYTGTTIGQVSQDIFGKNYVFNVGKVAISGSYNAIPRSIQKLDKLPDNLNNKLKLESNQEVTSLVVDLDGNGTNETIVCTTDWTQSHIKSDVILYDDNGEKVGRIIYMNEEGMFSEKGLSDSIEVIDIDNDGIMEIIADVPCYETENYDVTVLKFDGKKLMGEYDIGYIGA